MKLGSGEPLTAKSLSAPFVTWLYLSAYILLMGAELNSELERQVTGSTAPAN